MSDNKNFFSFTGKVSCTLSLKYRIHVKNAKSVDECILFNLCFFLSLHYSKLVRDVDIRICRNIHQMKIQMS